jgi:phytanoyl-CoA hydroxylase
MGVKRMLSQIGQVGLYNHFRRAGFLRARGAVSPDLVSRMRHVIMRDWEEKRRPFRTDAYGRLIRLDAVSRRDSVFLEALRSPAATDTLVNLLGPNIVLLQSRHDHATLNRHGDIPFRLHRDILQWSRPIATVIIYIDDAPVERGCTHVVPGSHMEAYAGMPPDGGGGNWADDHVEYQHLPDQSVPIPMESGDMLVLDSLAFHSVGKNITDKSRMSTTFAMRSVDELDRASERHVLLSGNWIYKGNDLDYDTVIPAQNNRQAQSAITD